MINLMQRKTPQERLVMGCAMFDFSKQIVKSALLRQNPDLSPAMLRKELFLRFYGNYFNSKQQKNILDYLSRSVR